MIVIPPPVITIDGVSGAGKGTLCKHLVKQLNWHVLDSGVLYRVLALAAMYHKIAINSEEALVNFITAHLDVSCELEAGKLHVVLEGKDVSQAIRHESVSNTASQIAVLPGVRDALIPRQRAFLTAPGLVADGRDMGTIVFPDAPVKIFLDASSEERARRRMQQLQANGFSVNFKRLLSDIKKRDNRDRNRIVAPLVPAADALVLDSTSLTIDEMIAKALAYASQILAIVTSVVNKLPGGEENGSGASIITPSSRKPDGR